jgi:hypothetical protein
MASASVTNKDHKNVTIEVVNLQYAVRDYQKFVFRFFQNGSLILSYTKSDWYQDSSSIEMGFTFAFENPNYLGNNWFAPATSYSVIVDCYYDDVAYSLNTVYFTTNSISPPSVDISPSVYPTKKNQGSYGNCVAMSLSTAMEIFRAKIQGVSSSYENYSVSYIFGSDGKTYDYMNFSEAVGLSKIYGSPRWELVTTQFPDSKSKADSVNIFNNATTLVAENAKFQKFTGSLNVDFYDCSSVANAISQYGYFMLNFRVPYNFYDIGSDGIVPQPNNGYSNYNHSISLIGSTTIDNKKYWIGQNSWGSGWGKYGICYIPYDWGCGVQSPQISSNISNTCGWTCECYSVWNSNIVTTNPLAPTITNVTQIGNTKDLTITWNNYTSGSYVQIYAKKTGTLDWYPKPAFESPYYGNSATISFDDYSFYEIVVVAIKDYLVSQRSNGYGCYITELTPWNWNYTKYGTDAYIAITNQGLTTNFRAVVWNDLIEKIRRVVEAFGYSWDNYYATLYETKVTPGDRIITAKRFNSARYNIGLHYSTGIQNMTKGDAMLGSYFVSLAAKLNEWLATL